MAAYGLHSRTHRVLGAFKAFAVHSPLRLCSLGTRLHTRDHKPAAKATSGRLNDKKPRMKRAALAKARRPEKKTPCQRQGVSLSGRRDLNPRPPEPHSEQYLDHHHQIVG